MPSSSNHDDLPSHRRSLLRQLAAMIIAGPRRVSRPNEAARPSRSSQTVRSDDHPTTEPRAALPASPQRTYAEAALNAERLREELRRNRHP
jgi:hypothetical protein